MKYYHIIEETTDQQTVEVFAETLFEALEIYFHFSTNEKPDLIEAHRNITTYFFPSETCTITKQSEQLLFIKWTHNKGSVLRPLKKCLTNTNSCDILKKNK